MIASRLPDLASLCSILSLSPLISQKKIQRRLLVQVLNNSSQLNVDHQARNPSALPIHQTNTVKPTVSERPVAYSGPCNLRPSHLPIPSILRPAISDTVLKYFQYKYSSILRPPPIIRPYFSG